jgi:hypothetical protein
MLVSTRKLECMPWCTWPPDVCDGTECIESLDPTVIANGTPDRPMEVNVGRILEDSSLQIMLNLTEPGVLEPVSAVLTLHEADQLLTALISKIAAVRAATSPRPAATDAERRLTETLMAASAALETVSSGGAAD